jgi:hypothetical protein
MTRNSNFKGLGIALGAALGVALGAITGNMGVWLAVGVAIGLAIGASVRPKKTDCPECAALHGSHGGDREERSPQ